MEIKYIQDSNETLYQYALEYLSKLMEMDAVQRLDDDGVGSSTDLKV